MIDSDKAEFGQLLLATYAMYSKECTKALLTIWWNALSPYPVDQVRDAFNRHMVGKRGTFCPVPADILSYLTLDSGHLSPDEAWALALTSTDESETIIWTDEIAQAMGAARPCIDAGDKYGARLAFLSAYERNLKTAPLKPRWWPTLGDNKLRREDVLLRGIEDGRLSLEYYGKMISPKSIGLEQLKQKALTHEKG